MTATIARHGQAQRLSRPHRDPVVVAAAQPRRRGAGGPADGSEPPTLAHPPRRISLRAVRSTIQLATLSSVAGLLFWAVMPALVGWEPAVVVSGSMMPAVRPGDVVVVASLPAATLARAKGMVVLVDDPAVPGTLLLHRVVGHTPDGALITKGDANRERDRAAVPLSDVHGAARLRVPFVGLPALWLRNGRTLPLAAFALVLVALAVPGRRERLGATPGIAALPPGRHRAGP